MPDSNSSPLANAAANHGSVISVRGSVVEVYFNGALPPIHSLLRAGESGRILIEVWSQVDIHRVRGIALTATQGLARGMIVTDTGKPLQAPVGRAIRSPKDKPTKIFAIVFGSDQGLVGQFNESLAGFVARELRTLPGQKILWAIGERMHDSLSEMALPPIARLNVPESVAGITSLIGEIQLAIQTHRSYDSFASVYVFHHRSNEITAPAPASQRLLPLDAQWQRNLAMIKWPTKRLPQIIGPDESAVRGFIREYFFVSMFQACAQSLAAENASRLAAMQRAEKNIDELCETLTRTFYQLRQSSLDAELFDVLAGYNSMN